MLHILANSAAITAVFLMRHPEQKILFIETNPSIILAIRIFFILNRARTNLKFLDFELSWILFLELELCQLYKANWAFALFNYVFIFLGILA